MVEKYFALEYYGEIATIVLMAILFVVWLIKKLVGRQMVTEMSSDSEKVIKGLKDIHDEAYDRRVHCQYTQDKLLMLIDKTIPDALALLREQEPVEPKWSSGIKRGGDALCGSCWAWLSDQSWAYCPRCGKKVKWK